MVQAYSGVLIKCDDALKAYLCHLDAVGERQFILYREIKLGTFVFCLSAHTNSTHARTLATLFVEANDVKLVCIP
jgi:hypothetical protein